MPLVEDAAISTRYRLMATLDKGYFVFWISSTSGFSSGFVPR